MNWVALLRGQNCAWLIPHHPAKAKKDIRVILRREVRKLRSSGIGNSNKRLDCLAGYLVFHLLGPLDRLVTMILAGRAVEIKDLKIWFRDQSPCYQVQLDVFLCYLSLLPRYCSFSGMISCFPSKCCLKLLLFAIKFLVADLTHAIRQNNLFNM